MTWANIIDINFDDLYYVLLQPLRPELEIQLEQFKEALSKPAQL
jgi:hypothetical protein